MSGIHPGRRARVDGNAAGGRLWELFGRDMTTARAQCGQCDRVAELADAIAEVDDAGVILLCRGCSRMLLTCLRSGDGEQLVIGALARLELR
ncbi:hypothetical protein KZC51_01510 [Microbacterium sp. SSW1-49]|uniref:Uncharacterized protein n=1 Tax=Microbacterium croceum TaxID=2851645 RepID=A0ABT0FAT1_9MICO|nr:DUF6510 family protein [Microbacterium croceum]MCK2034799.1 hypothetical protein [Microbacterium croceum]